MANQISDLQQTLIRETAGMQSGFRWVPPQNMHVTVRFLGNITEPMIQAIKDSLEKVTEEAVPFQMEAGELRVFEPESPRILYCSITDSEGELEKLVQKVHEVLENTGFKEMGTPFIPHVTLARIDNGVPEEIQRLAENVRLPAGCVSQVRTLVCYQSNLMKTGVDYHLLWKLPFEKRNHTKSNPPEKSTREADTSADLPEVSVTESNEPVNESESEITSHLTDPEDNGDTAVETVQGEQEL